MAQVSLHGIAKSYDGAHQVVRGVDLEIGDGEFVVFVGPSGCGKSTLLRMIAGLEEISAGELRIGERRANETAPAERGLAMVFQSYALYPHMTVYENMAFALKLAGQHREAVREAVERAAAILQIGHLLARKPRELSGGQRQRVAIGRAIVRKPEVFLFDEPLSNLDASLRVQMRVEIGRLHRELNTTMIYVTHDQVEAMTLGQRIVVFNGGRIEQVGTPAELYRRPANLFVAGFLGSPTINKLAATVVEARPERVVLRLPDGAALTLPLQGASACAGDAVTLAIRAEHLAVGEAGDAAGIAARVGHVEYLGDQSIVYAAVPGVAEMLAAKLASGQAPPAAGAALSLHLPAEHCHLFNIDGAAFPPAS